MSAETIPALPMTADLPVSEPSAPVCSAYLPPGAIVMSVEEYLEWERDSEVRYEYVDFYAIPKDGVEVLEDGEIRAMSGESPGHNRIAGNIYVSFDREIGDRPCEVYFESIRLRVSPTKYRYPDVAALCGPAQFDAAKPPCLLNPSVLVEVLSPSTQRTDQNEKFTEYKRILTLTDYVLIAQDRMFVTHYARQSATQWLITDYTQLGDTLTFATLNVSITLADMYRRIVFAPSA